MDFDSRKESDVGNNNNSEEERTTIIIVKTGEEKLFVTICNIYGIAK